MLKYLFCICDNVYLFEWRKCALLTVRTNHRSSWLSPGGKLEIKSNIWLEHTDCYPSPYKGVHYILVNPLAKGLPPHICMCSPHFLYCCLSQLISPVFTVKILIWRVYIYLNRIFDQKLTRNCCFFSLSFRKCCSGLW